MLHFLEEVRVGDHVTLSNKTIGWLSDSQFPETNEQSRCRNNKALLTCVQANPLKVVYQGDISPFWNLSILDTLYENICSRDHLHRSDEDVCLERKSFLEQWAIHAMEEWCEEELSCFFAHQLFENHFTTCTHTCYQISFNKVVHSNFTKIQWSVSSLCRASVSFLFLVFSSTLLCFKVG